MRSHLMCSLHLGAATGLPSYRGLVSAPTTSVAVRPNSDPYFSALAPSKRLHIENEPGVHGGEYAVRPNMQESMVFLRKLFSHQQEGNPFPPTLLSPPDSPMRKSSVPNSNIEQCVSKHPFPFRSI
jgi:hypothetical protein